MAVWRAKKCERISLPDGSERPTTRPLPTTSKRSERESRLRTSKGGWIVSSHMPPRWYVPWWSRQCHDDAPGVPGGGGTPAGPAPASGGHSRGVEAAATTRPSPGSGTAAFALQPCSADEGRRQRPNEPPPRRSGRASDEPGGSGCTVSAIAAVGANRRVTDFLSSFRYGLLLSAPVLIQICFRREQYDANQSLPLP